MNSDKNVRGGANRVVSVLYFGTAAIFIIAPFYAPLSVWAASSFKHFDFLKIWKEFALTGLGLLLIGYLLKNRTAVRILIRDKLLLAMSVYVGYSLLMAVYGLLGERVSTDAIIYGLLVNLRLIGFFGLTYLLTSLKQRNYQLPWRKLVLIPATLVIGFGLLQFSILPKDVLRHIGYSQQTITPYQSVDNRPDFARVQSTLRGPNPFGAYLVVVMCLILSLLLLEKRHQAELVALLAAGLATLYATYSRAAWLGLMFSVVVMMVAYLPRRLWRTALIIGVLAVMVICGSLLALRNSYVVQNLVFHSSPRSTAAQSSNAQRASGLKNGISDIIHQPLGDGIGSAGPASLRNTEDTPRISENYYLQIGQETGLVGLALFCLITVMLFVRLWAIRQTTLSLALTASLVGLTFISMTTHAWVDDTLAYIWWGLAGIALAAPAILNKKRKHNGTEEA